MEGLKTMEELCISLSSYLKFYYIILITLFAAFECFSYAQNI